MFIPIKLAHLIYHVLHQANCFLSGSSVYDKDVPRTLLFDKLSLTKPIIDRRKKRAATNIFRKSRHWDRENKYLCSYFICNYLQFNSFNFVYIKVWIHYWCNIESVQLTNFNIGKVKLSQYENIFMKVKKHDFKVSFVDLIFYVDVHISVLSNTLYIWDTPPP